MTRPGVVHLLLALLVTWQCGAEDHQDHQHVSSLHLYNECVHQLHAPRVALLFLVRYDLWHRELWRQWLLSASGIAPMAALVQSAHRQSGNMEHAADHIILACINATAANTFATRRQYLFSVHQHISPEVPFDPDAQLGGELLPDNQRIATHWAGTNLVDATRRLLQHALQDPLNHFFVLLSEASIPLYPPLVVYQQLLHRNTSAVNACPWVGGEVPDIERFDKSFRNTGLFERPQWRKSCQFVGLLRSHASLVASDLPLWKAYLERCPGSTPCVADEHYVPLALSLNHLEHETDCHGRLTYSHWSPGVTIHGTDTSPTLFQADNITAHFLAALRAGSGAAVTHCARLAMHPPPVDMGSFALLSRTQGPDVVQAAGRAGGAGPGVAPPLYAMHPHCPMFARKFAASERNRLLHVLQQHPMDVLPDTSVHFRRYNAGGRRARITTRGLADVL